MQPQTMRLNLAAIRRNRGLSLHEIAERTKIGTRYLSAIEDENFAVLPGRIYSVSYIRQYASAIDYDAGAILSLYRECVAEAEEPDLSPSVPPARDSGTDPLWGTVRRAFTALRAGLIGDAR